jgi:hypothetical protein
MQKYYRTLYKKMFAQLDKLQLKHHIKCILIDTGTVTPLHLLFKKMKIKVLKHYFFI